MWSVSHIFSQRTEEMLGVEPGQKNTVQWEEIAIILKYVEIYCAEMTWHAIIHSFGQMVTMTTHYHVVPATKGCGYQAMVPAFGYTTSWGGGGAENCSADEWRGRGQLKGLWGCSRGHPQPRLIRWLGGTQRKGGMSESWKMKEISPMDEWGE